MPSPKIDLYLGGELGLWALRQARGPEQVARVFTFDGEIAAEARALGLEAHTENANAVEFEPAPVGFSVHYPRVIRPGVIPAAVLRESVPDLVGDA